MAGRHQEQAEFRHLLTQDLILRNALLTGLRGVGKTVLSDRFKQIAQTSGWLWVGEDLSETAGFSEMNLAIRILTDIAVVSESFVRVKETEPGQCEDQHITFSYLMELCSETPGLFSDKLKAVLEHVYTYMPDEYRGIIFAYDEAQNIGDHSERGEYPLSVLLEVFQSLQKKSIPFMLLLTGLPTLQPKLVEARTYSERMFDVMFLERLSSEESKEAICKPIAADNCPVRFDEKSIDTIIKVSGGYPFFIQFICQQVYDVFVQQAQRGDTMSVPIDAIMRKLDTSFFRGRWGPVGEDISEAERASWCHR